MNYSKNKGLPLKLVMAIVVALYTSNGFMFFHSFGKIHIGLGAKKLTPDHFQHSKEDEQFRL